MPDMNITKKWAIERIGDNMSSTMYWLEIAKPDGELTIYEMMTSSQILWLRNLAITAGYPVRTGKH